MARKNGFTKSMAFLSTSLLPFSARKLSTKDRPSAGFVPDDFEGVTRSASRFSRTSFVISDYVLLELMSTVSTSWRSWPSSSSLNWWI